MKVKLHLLRDHGATKYINFIIIFLNPKRTALTGKSSQRECLLHIVNSHSVALWWLGPQHHRLWLKRLLALLKTRHSDIFEAILFLSSQHLVYDSVGLYRCHAGFVMLHSTELGNWKMSAELWKVNDLDLCKEHFVDFVHPVRMLQAAVRWSTGRILPMCALNFNTKFPNKYILTLLAANLLRDTSWEVPALLL